MREIGPWLKELRRRKGVSQSQLSEEMAARYDIHLEPSRYSQMERGKEGPPTLKTFLSMIDYYSADLATLFGPSSQGQITGLDFVFTDPVLTGELLQLRDTWGEDEAGRILLQLSRLVNSLNESDGRGRRYRAARPQPGESGPPGR